MMIMSIEVERTLRSPQIADVMRMKMEMEDEDGVDETIKLKINEFPTLGQKNGTNILRVFHEAAKLFFCSSGLAAVEVLAVVGEDEDDEVFEEAPAPLGCGDGGGASSSTNI